MSTAAARKSSSGGRLLLGLLLTGAGLLAAPGPGAMRAIEMAAVSAWTSGRGWADAVVAEGRRRLGRQPAPGVAVGVNDGRPLSGDYLPVDERTRALAGVVTFKGAEIRLETGGVLKTRPYRLVSSQDAAARDTTWSAALAVPAGVQVEVREVTDGAAPALCGGAAVGWLALVQADDATTLLPLKAGARPGEGEASSLCPLLRVRLR